jgi:segregation and condensation protein A
MYNIKLQDFEGPFDLLLFFVKRDELDIYDIPIAHITKEFLEYLQIMKLLDLDIAGDFIVMASMLMQIKARMLLPRDENAEEEEEDPRADLIRRLIEYKRYKEMAHKFARLELQQSRHFNRTNFQYDEREIEDDEEEFIMKNVTLFDLISAFKHAIDKMPRIRHHDIEKVPVTVEEQMHLILHQVEKEGNIGFFRLISNMKRIEVVVTFIALLEMARANQISFEQKTAYNDFVILKKAS